MSFIIPIARGFYGWVLPKVFNRAAGQENDAATFFMKTTIGCSYAFYVAVRLKHADEFTANFMLGVEFLINLCYVLQLILMHTKVQGNMTAEEIRKWKRKNKLY